MSQYARDTSVSVAKSRDEIERILRRYKANSFAYGWDDDKALVGFTMNDRQIRLTLPLPSPSDKTFVRTSTGRARTNNAAETAYEQAVRSRWRALKLVIQAKLEAVASGIVTFEDEWASYVVLPDGRTVGAHLTPVIERAYATGTVPSMLSLERS